MQKFERVFSDAMLPSRKTAKSAGYDMYLYEDVTIPPLKDGFVKPKLVSTGVKVKLDPDKWLMIVPRSSLSSQGLMLANTVGVIDSDYYGNPSNGGEIFAMFFNLSDTPVELKKGDRVMQGIICSYDKVDYDDTEAERIGGVGSTGK